MSAPPSTLLHFHVLCIWVEILTILSSHVRCFLGIILMSLACPIYSITHEQKFRNSSVNLQYLLQCIPHFLDRLNFLKQLHCCKIFLSVYVQQLHICILVLMIFSLSFQFQVLFLVSPYTYAKSYLNLNFRDSDLVVMLVN